MRSVLEAHGGYRVTLVNPYREILTDLDPFARWTGRTVEETYNAVILGGGRTGLFCLGFFALSAVSVAALRRTGRRAFARLWGKTKPDLVVSVLPVLNPAMIDSLKTWRGGTVPFAIMMTDWAELLPFVWFPRGSGYAAIAGTQPGLARLRAKRHPQDRTFATGGLLIRPEFLEPLPDDPGAERAALGLEPERPTIVVTYGGHGSPRMVALARALAEAGVGLQVIFLCGRNEAIVEELQAADLPFPHLIRGYCEDIHRYMAVADVFVGKAGPQSVSEALALGLPVLIDGWRVLPQERALTRWIRVSGVGTTFRRASGFVRKAEALAARPRPYEARAAARTNTAARDLVRIVQTLLKTAPEPAAVSVTGRMHPGNDAAPPQTYR
jgi:1,2-diacylglycerol 3-beta-galactosyltransferase